MLILHYYFYLVNIDKTLIPFIATEESKLYLITLLNKN